MMSFPRRQPLLFQRPFILWAGATVLFWLFSGFYCGVTASETKLFDVGQDNWVPVEQYSGDETEASAAQIVSPAEMTAAAKPSGGAAPGSAGSAVSLSVLPKGGVAVRAPASVSSAAPSATPSASAPVVSKDVDIYVDSTVEDTEGGDDADSGALELSRPLNLPAMPGTGAVAPASSSGGSSGADEAAAYPPLENDLWKDAQQYARMSWKLQIPINIRLSTLPDANVKSAPGSPVIRPHRQAAAAVPSVPKKEAKKKDPDVCAAISNFRKRQLAAIASDRKTLDALKAVVAEMGLEKKLDFTNGVSTGLIATPKEVAPASSTESTASSKPAVSKPKTP